MKLAAEHETFTLSKERLRLVVVADTHGNPHHRSAELVAREQPDRILHAGDIGDLRVLEGLARIAPVSAVRGNIDIHAKEIPDVRTIDIQADGVLAFRLLLLHIAVNGPKLRSDAARRAREEDVSLVVCGHSHVPFLTRDSAFVVFNPGSIGPRRFTLPIVFGVIDIARGGIDIRHVDCETGERWLPRGKVS